MTFCVFLTCCMIFSLVIYKFTKSFPCSTSSDSTIVSTNINKVPKWFFCGPKIQMREGNNIDKFQVVYYKCVKFHKNPISRLGGVVLTRYTQQMNVTQYYNWNTVQSGIKHHNPFFQYTCSRQHWWKDKNSYILVICFNWLEIN
jgi:hypothetical protein